MDSFEWNKVFGALLAMAFVVLGVNFLSDALYHSDTPEKAGFVIEGGEVETAVATKPAAPVVEPVEPLLASADLAKGEKVMKKCASCHTYNEGGKKKVGPNLYDIVNRQIAGLEGFAYSSALKAYGEGKTWTYAELNGFLKKPKTHVKGTNMNYPGIKKVDERAALIAFMRSLSSEPAPLPGS